MGDKYYACCKYNVSNADIKYCYSRWIIKNPILREIIDYIEEQGLKWRLDIGRMSGGGKSNRFHSVGKFVIYWN